MCQRRPACLSSPPSPLHALPPSSPHTPQGFTGDETIQELLAAVQTAALGLPSMQQRVPAGWLAVYDELSKQLSSADARQWLSLAEVTALARTCGLPHMPSSLSLELEVNLMLAFLHSIGAVCWFDLPALRDLVILDPQVRRRESLSPCSSLAQALPLAA